MNKRGQDIKKLLQNISLVFISTLLIILVLNIIYFIFFHKSGPYIREGGPHMRESSLSGVEVEHIPGVKTFKDGVEVVINSYGFRDYEFSIKKPKGLCRIVALGDSVTFGQGVPVKETFPKQLEILLNRDPDSDLRFEVLNAGVPSYNTIQEAAVLKYRILPLKPDMLLLGFTEANDPEIKGLEDYSLDRFLGRARVIRKVLPLVDYLLFRIEQKRGGEEGYRHYVDIYRPDGKPWRSCVSALKDILMTCRENDIDLVVVLIPTLTQDDVDTEERLRLKKTLNDLGIPYIDTHPGIRDIPEEKMPVSEYDPHPSALVHKRFAEIIYRWLKQNPERFKCLKGIMDQSSSNKKRLE